MQRGQSQRRKSANPQHKPHKTPIFPPASAQAGMRRLKKRGQFYHGANLSLLTDRKRKRTLKKLPVLSPAHRAGGVRSACNICLPAVRF